MRYNLYWIICDKCHISTKGYNSEAEAVAAWNLAMSGRKQKCAKKTRYPEHTGRWMIRKNDKNSDDICFVCTECGFESELELDECPSCGARMEQNGTLD